MHMNSNMTPVDWAKRPVMEKYADFSGRAPRAEYWWYALALFVAFIVLGILEGIVGLKGMIGAYGPLTALLWLATIVPSLAVAVRRLHDTGRTGWWVLLPIIPYCLAFFLGGAAMMGGAASGSAIGMTAGMGVAGIFLLIGIICAIVLLVFMLLPSQPGDNRYGPNPYGEGNSGPVAAE
jgi:uncharacterized membrane protein YhaH (DUF805 family)